MGVKIKEFRDGTFLEYDRGSFDDWCVYYTNTVGCRKPPRDTDYFQQLVDYSQRYGVDRIYEDYVRVYEMTGKEIENHVLEAISEIADEYGGDIVSIDVIFSILYMAMIAEERKKYTKLGKRIKRLGIHVLLMEGRSVEEAANFMRGMGWREIDALCKERGF